MSDYLDALIEEAAIHGQTSAGESTYANRWQPEEDEFLRQNWGWLHISEIARRLGRTVYAVDIHKDRRLDDIPATTQHPDWLTAHEVARRLGVPCMKSITRLIRDGLLPARMAPLDRAIYLVSVDSLTKFAVNPENWVYFKSHRVRDARLRRMILIRQARWGDEWWSVGQAAAYHGVGVNAVNAHIHRGWLKGKRWGNWWIRRSDAIRARFVGANGQPVIRWTESADSWLVLARAVGLSWGAVERLSNWPRTRPNYRFDTLATQGRLAALCEAQGILYDPARNLVLADWRNYSRRFPRLTEAVDRFLGDHAPTGEDLSIVAGVLSAWGQWYATTSERFVQAEGWRHYSVVIRATVEKAYRELLGWGVDPLSEVNP